MRLQSNNSFRQRPIRLRGSGALPVVTHNEHNQISSCPESCSRSREHVSFIRVIVVIHGSLYDDHKKHKKLQRVYSCLFVAGHFHKKMWTLTPVKRRRIRQLLNCRFRMNIESSCRVTARFARLTRPTALRQKVDRSKLTLSNSLYQS